VRHVHVWRIRTLPPALNSTTVRVELPLARHVTWTSKRGGLSITWGRR
jgi:hypothetical protein